MVPPTSPSRRFGKYLTLAVVLSLATGPLAAQTYTFQTVAFPSKLSFNVTFAWGIDDAGAVAGTFRFNPEGKSVTRSRGFQRHADGTFSRLIIDPNEYKYSTFAQPINDAGTIVGYYYGSDINYHGYIDIGGTFTTVNALSSPSTEIYGINNSGDFVGGAGPHSGPATHGFLSRGGAITQIDVPGFSTGTTAYGIDDAGTIVGCAASGSDSVGFIRGPLGVIHTFSVARSFNTCPSSVRTGIGVVVGTFEDDKTGARHGFVYTFAPGATSPDPASQGSLTVLDYPGATQTILSGVNSQGRIVGYADIPSGGGTQSIVSFIATPSAGPATETPEP